MLVGRHEERARIDRLLDQAAAGRGGALAILGEAGIGKTALLEYARMRASEATVVVTTGVESELELPFAGLADVLRPLLGYLDELPESQHELIRVALALGPARPMDRFAMGAASLALLAAAAGEGMLLVLVDDAHWLDAASRDALLFAARRLGADPVALIFAARGDEQVPFAAGGVAALVLSGLRHEDVAALLDGVVADDALDALIELTRGNPLALLELPATLSEAQLHGRAALEQPLRVGAGIQRAFARRALMLGESTRRALLVAAADDSGSVAVVEAACSKLGAGTADLRRAEDADLLHATGRRSSSGIRSFGLRCTRMRRRRSGAMPIVHSPTRSKRATSFDTPGTQPRRRLGPTQGRRARWPRWPPRAVPVERTQQRQQRSSVPPD
jgi:hypothetical protein